MLGGSEHLTGEVTRLVGQIPPAVNALTGVDLSKVPSFIIQLILIIQMIFNVVYPAKTEAFSSSSCNSFFNEIVISLHKCLVLNVTFNLPVSFSQ